MINNLNKKVNVNHRISHEKLSELKVHHPETISFNSDLVYRAHQWETIQIPGMTPKDPLTTAYLFHQTNRSVGSDPDPIPLRHSSLVDYQFNHLSHFFIGLSPEYFFERETMGAVSPRPILVKAQTPDSPTHGIVDKPSPITKLSISKNYVIPPRPKPGRKPSNDIPPSRRKAQNRDAQRAFRERKSQAVRALEEKLAKQAQEFEKQQAIMREQILMLQKQNDKGGNTNGAPVGAPGVPGSAGTLSQASSPGMDPNCVSMNSIQSSSSPTATTPQGQMVPMYSPIQFRPVLSPAAPHSYNSQPMSPQPVGSPQSPGSPFGTPVTPADIAGLELLDHVLDQKLPVQQQQQQSQQSSQMKRRASKSSKTSPESPQSPGVIRIEPPAADNPLDLVNTNWSQPAVPLRRKSSALEVDFTRAFTPRSPRQLSLPSPPAPKDRCGFCTDNTPCICAASAAREEGAGMAPDLATLGSPLVSGDSSLSSSSFDTNSFLNSPGASSPRRSSLSQMAGFGRSSEAEDQANGCTGNPGNCSQCRQDPMLTLFCSAIASKPPAVRTPALGTYIPALAAYKTLSRHPRFVDADLGEVVNTLLVKSSQVEVNSVAKVLRLLDTK